MRLVKILAITCAAMLMCAGFSPAPQNLPAYQIRYGTTLPAICSADTGDVFILTGGPQELYVCTAANTWTRIIRNAPGVFTITGAVNVASFTRTDAGHAHIEIANTVGTTEFGIGLAGEPHIDAVAGGTEINFRIAGTDALVVSGAGGALRFTGLTFATLGAPANGTVVYCSDCTIAAPCAGGGTGALAKRLNGAWVCN